MKTIDLPRWPSRGNRRTLDRLWLAEVERRGLHALLTEVPTEAPPEMAKALAEFNDGLYWECHETLEEVWRKTPYPLRFFYHALIKVAVGLHHLSRRNRHGAQVKLADGERLLRLFLPHFWGVRTDLLHRDVARWLAQVRRQGPIRWAEMDTGETPRIVTQGKGQKWLTNSQSGVAR